MFEVWAWMTNGFYRVATTNLIEDAQAVLGNHKSGWIQKSALENPELIVAKGIDELSGSQN